MSTEFLLNLNHPIGAIPISQEFPYLTTLPYDHTITGMLQTAAELITLKPKGDWPSWVMFLLTELQSITPAQSYADLLAQLQEGIDGQLAEMAS